MMQSNKTDETIVHAEPGERSSGSACAMIMIRVRCNPGGFSV
jgi:hypothetical protein